MIRLEDWLIKYNPLNGLYALSHSQYIEDSASSREPYHIGRLHSDLYDNTRDCLHNYKQEKWQIVFIGSFSKCVERQNDLCVMKKWDSDQLRDWAAETFVEFRDDEQAIEPAPRMDAGPDDNEFFPGLRDDQNEKEG